MTPPGSRRKSPLLNINSLGKLKRMCDQANFPKIFLPLLRFGTGTENKLQKSCEYLKSSYQERLRSSELRASSPAHGRPKRRRAECHLRIG